MFVMETFFVILVAVIAIMSKYLCNLEAAEGHESSY